MHTHTSPLEATSPISSSGPRSFVVPLDGSAVAERALPVARVLANRFGASMDVINVPCEPDDPRRTPRLDVCTEAPENIADGSVVCVTLRGHDERLPGTHPDLVMRVLQRAGTPALVVGPHCSSGSFDVDGPVVVCHDGSAMSRSVLVPARAWATALGLPIYLVHVWNPLNVETARDPRADIAVALETLGPSARFEPIRSSFPAGAIRELAREVDASIIAMSTLVGTGLPRLLLGNVTQWIIREAFCPVLVRRPPPLPST